MTRAGEGFHTARKAPVVSEKFWEGWAACLQEIPPPRQLCLRPATVSILAHNCCFQTEQAMDPSVCSKFPSMRAGCLLTGNGSRLFSIVYLTNLSLQLVIFQNTLSKSSGQEMVVQPSQEGCVHGAAVRAVVCS